MLPSSTSCVSPPFYIFMCSPVWDQREWFRGLSFDPSVCLSVWRRLPPVLYTEEQPLKAFIRSWSKTSGLELLSMTTGRPELQLPRPHWGQEAGQRSHTWSPTYRITTDTHTHTHTHPHGNIVTVPDNRTTTKQSACVSSHAERSSDGNNLY